MSEPAAQTPIPEPVAEAPVITPAAAPSIIVHHLDDSRSQRILWLLEELEVPYEIKTYKRLPTKQAPPELKEIHPLGKSPVVTDGSLTLAESGAIVEYLLTKYANGRFQVPKEGYVDNLYFTHYAEGSFQPISVIGYIFQLIPERSPLLLRPLTRAISTNFQTNFVDPQMKAHGKLIEDHLAKSPTGWFAGGTEPTSADFMMIFPCETLKARGKEPVGPKTQEFLDRVHARPAYKIALEKGGEYAYA